MLCRTVVALLFTFAVVGSYSQQLWHSGSQVLSLDFAYNATMGGPWNLHTDSILTFTYTAKVQICVVYAEFGLPRSTEFSAENCLWYYNSSKDNSDSYHLPLLQKAYKIGVWYADPPAKADNATVSLELAGETCPPTSPFFDDLTKACVSAEALAGNDTISWSSTFSQGETKYFTYETLPGLANLTLEMVARGPDALGPLNSVISARFEATPSYMPDVMDLNSTFTINTPRQGIWVFSVHAAEAGTADFTLDTFQCGAQSGGPGCDSAVHLAADNMTLNIKQGEWFYYRFELNHTNPFLRVSVTSSNVSNIPQIYASRGQIPYRPPHSEVVVADVLNCNQDYCSEVRSIFYNSTANSTEMAVDGPQVWYVGITTNTPGNTTFGLWWNNTCVPNCDTDNHGECQDSGRCLCEIDYEGIDCSTSKGLGPQYIVLIIIASLVVASAIIGFVAWAYMRRKRANYEIVS